MQGTEEMNEPVLTRKSRGSTRPKKKGLEIRAEMCKLLGTGQWVVLGPEKNAALISGNPIGFIPRLNCS